MFRLSRAVKALLHPSLAQEMREAAQECCPVRAVALARLLKKLDLEPTCPKGMFWLCKAASYSPNGLQGVVNLDDFLKGVIAIDETAIIDPYGKEIVAAIHRSPSINELRCFSRCGFHTEEALVRIRDFLRTTDKINCLVLGGIKNSSLFDSSSIDPIAAALGENKSIHVLYLHINLTFRGVEKLLWAIASNPLSSVGKISLVGCPMGPFDKEACEKVLRRYGLKIELFFNPENLKRKATA
jgi:hypothetical protein